MSDTSPSVAVTFKTHYNVHRYTHNLAVIGSIQQLGSWNPQNCLCLNRVPGSNFDWTGTINLHVGQRFEWKLVLLDKSSRRIIRWEESSNRHTALQTSGNFEILTPWSDKEFINQLDTHQDSLVPERQGSVSRALEEFVNFSDSDTCTVAPERESNITWATKEFENNSDSETLVPESNFAFTIRDQFYVDVNDSEEITVRDRFYFEQDDNEELTVHMHHHVVNDKSKATPVDELKFRIKHGITSGSLRKTSDVGDRYKQRDGTNEGTRRGILKGISKDTSRVPNDVGHKQKSMANEESSMGVPNRALSSNKKKKMAVGCKSKHKAKVKEEPALAKETTVTGNNSKRSLITDALTYKDIDNIALPLPRRPTTIDIYKHTNDAHKATIQAKAKDILQPVAPEVVDRKVKVTKTDGDDVTPDIQLSKRRDNEADSSKDEMSIGLVEIGAKDIIPLETHDFVETKKKTDNVLTFDKQNGINRDNDTGFDSTGDETRSVIHRLLVAKDNDPLNINGVVEGRNKEQNSEDSADVTHGIHNVKTCDKDIDDGGKLAEVNLATNPPDTKYNKHEFDEVINNETKTEAGFAVTLDIQNGDVDKDAYGKGDEITSGTQQSNEKDMLYISEGRNTQTNTKADDTDNIDIRKCFSIDNHNDENEPKDKSYPDELRAITKNNSVCYNNATVEKRDQEDTCFVENNDESREKCDKEDKEMETPNMESKIADDKLTDDKEPDIYHSMTEHEDVESDEGKQFTEDCTDDHKILDMTEIDNKVRESGTNGPISSDIQNVFTKEDMKDDSGIIIESTVDKDSEILEDSTCTGCITSDNPSDDTHVHERVIDHYKKGKTEAVPKAPEAKVLKFDIDKATVPQQSWKADFTKKLESNKYYIAVGGTKKADTQYGSDCAEATQSSIENEVRTFTTNRRQKDSIEVSRMKIKAKITSNRKNRRLNSWYKSPRRRIEDNPLFDGVAMLPPSEDRRNSYVLAATMTAVLAASAIACYRYIQS